MEHLLISITVLVLLLLYYKLISDSNHTNTDLLISITVLVLLLLYYKLISDSTHTNTVNSNHQIGGIGWWHALQVNT